MTTFIGSIAPWRLMKKRPQKRPFHACYELPYIGQLNGLIDLGIQRVTL